jgi:hypothetical protein
MSLGWIVNAFCKMYKVSFFGCWFAAKKTLPLKENISSPVFSSSSVHVIFLQ